MIETKNLISMHYKCKSFLHYYLIMYCHIIKNVWLL